MVSDVNLHPYTAEDTGEEDIAGGCDAYVEAVRRVVNEQLAAEVGARAAAAAAAKADAEQSEGEGKGGGEGEVEDGGEGEGEGGAIPRRRRSKSELR